MKKLMTMIAAVATAFGLYAEGLTPIGASFETTDSTGVDLTWTAADKFGSEWSDLGNSVVTNDSYTYAKAATVGYPDVFNKGSHAQYLKIETTLGTPATMAIGAQAVRIDKNLYFDAMVNMTVFDYGEENAPDVTGAKIAIYLQQADENDDTQKNFVVATGADSRYVCANADVSEGWHRITIKAIENVYASGTAASAFKVFVDGAAVNSGDAKEAFDSTRLTPVAYQYWGSGQLFLNPGAAEIASVGFDGKGAVDDIVFTETAPSGNNWTAGDPNMYVFTWDVEKVSGVEYWNGEDYVSVADVTAGSQTLTAIPTGFKVKWTGAGNYIDGANENITLVDNQAVAITSTYTEGDATFDDGTTVKAYTLADAIGAANTAETAGTLKLLHNAEKVAIDNANAVITLDLGGKELTGATGPTIDTGSGTVIISNGVVTAGDDSAVYGDGFQIMGGTFNGELAGEGGQVYGGSFSADPSTYVAKGYAASKSNNRWEVVQLTGTVIILADGAIVDQYDTLKAAAAAVQNGQTIKIMDDLTNQAPTKAEQILIDGTNKDEFAITIENNAIVDIANCKDGASATYPFLINGATVTFTGTGTFRKISGAGSMIQAGATNAAAIIVNNGTFIGGNAEDPNSDAPSNLIQIKGGTGVFNNGTYTNYRTDQGRCVRSDHSNGSTAVTINGGSYTAKTPVNAEAEGDLTIPADSSAQFSDDVSQYCVDGYVTAKTVDSGDWYVVTVATEQPVTVTINTTVANARVTTVKVNEKTVQEAPATLDVGRTLEVIWTADGGYAFSGPDKDGKYTTTAKFYARAVKDTPITATIEAPAVKVAYAITYTFKTNDVDVAEADLTGLVKTMLPATYTVEDAITFAASLEGYDFEADPASIAAGSTGAKSVTVKFTKKSQSGPQPTGFGGGGVEPVQGEPGVYVVSGDASSHNVSIDPNTLQPTDRIRVTDSTIGKITGVPANQIEIKLNGVTTAIDQKYFVGGDDKGFSLELSDAAKAVLVEETADDKPLVIGEDVDVTIQSVAGLKYQLVRGTEVGAITTKLGEPVVGDGQPLTLTDGDKPAEKAFYVIETSK